MAVTSAQPTSEKRTVRQDGGSAARAGPPAGAPVPGAARPHDSGIRRTFEGSSLETIRHMVASGIGVTVLPRTSVPSPVPADSLLRFVPFDDPVPGRRVVLAWRKSFPRRAAIDVVRAAVRHCTLDGITKLDVASFTG